MKKAIGLFLMISFFVLGGCNTIEGLGKDVKKGGEVIEKAVGTVYDEVDDEKQAREYVGRKRLKKPKDKKETARIFRNLMRAGFASKTIFKILKTWDVDDETITALESEVE